METKGVIVEFIDNSNKFKRTILIERLERCCLSEDEDIRYFQENLIRALRIPLNYML